MTIEVSSAGWTGNSEPDQVCGEFQDQQALDAAMSRFEASQFERTELTVRTAKQNADDPDSGAITEDDQQNLRQLGTSTASAAAGMAAAGVVVATGGAALPAVAAAAAAGGAAAAAGEAAGATASPDHQPDEDQAGRAKGPVLVVQAKTLEKQAKAEELLQANGAIRIWRQASAG